MSIEATLGLELPSIDALKEWGYGCLDLNQEQLVCCTVMMLRHVGAEQVKVDITKASNFMGEIFSRYNRVPYHNMYHAFNVVQGVFSALQHPLLEEFPIEEKVAMLIAAAGHDAAHDGANAAFHVGVESDLSLHYNDKSILENMHAWHTFNAMRAHDGECDLLGRLDADKRKLYDRGGKEMVEKGGGGGGFNPFGGGGGGGGGSRTKKGKSVSHTLKVTLDELYNGSVRKLRLGAHFMAALTVHAMRPATRGCSTPHRVLTRGALA